MRKFRLRHGGLNILCEVALHVRSDVDTKLDVAPYYRKDICF